MYVCFFILSSIDEHLCSFYILAIVINTAMNIGCMYLFKFVCSVFVRSITLNGILGSYGSLIFSFLRDCHTAFHSVCTNFIFLPTVYECFLFSKSLPMCVICGDHLTITILTGVRGYLVVVLIYILLMINDVGDLLMCLLAICISSLKKCLFRSSAHFLIGCLFFDLKMDKLFIYFWTFSSLLVISFANIFSHSVGCLFASLMVSFLVQKILSLIRPHLLIFAFVSFAFGDRWKKCYNLCQRVFSSRSFMVSGQTLRSNPSWVYFCS